MKITTTEGRLKEAFHRVAYVLKSLWKDGRGAHSRLFETLVGDDDIVIGTSVEGGGYREHVVPCCLIRDIAFDMYDKQRTVDDVAEMVGRLLRIAYITKKEANRLNTKLGLRTSMPAGWDPETGSVMARLDAAKIELEQNA